MKGRTPVLTTALVLLSLAPLPAAAATQEGMPIPVQDGRCQCEWSIDCRGGQKWIFVDCGESWKAASPGRHHVSRRICGALYRERLRRHSQPDANSGQQSPGPAASRDLGKGDITPSAHPLSEKDARDKFTANGFREVQNLKLDKTGVWRGTAIANGQRQDVAIDGQGDMVAKEQAPMSGTMVQTGEVARRTLRRGDTKLRRQSRWSWNEGRAGRDPSCCGCSFSSATQLPWRCCPR